MLFRILGSIFMKMKLLFLACILLCACTGPEEKYLEVTNQTKKKVLVNLMTANYSCGWYGKYAEAELEFINYQEHLEFAEFFKKSLIHSVENKKDSAEKIQRLEASIVSSRDAMVSDITSGRPIEKAMNSTTFWKQTAPELPSNVNTCSKLLKFSVYMVESNLKIEGI